MNILKPWCFQWCFRIGVDWRQATTKRVRCTESPIPCQSPSLQRVALITHQAITAMWHQDLVPRAMSEFGCVGK